MKTFLCVLLASSIAAFSAAPPPDNDNFINRIALVASGSISVAGVNAKATTQANEPTIDGDLVSKSVWWSWTAPFSGPTTIDTTGSSFDTLLGIFTGTALGSLSSVAENDDKPGGFYTSSVTFNAVGGVPYVVLIGGYNGASGKIKLNITVSSGGCTYTLSPSSKSFSNLAATSTVSVSTVAGCVWSAVSNDSWITITSGNTGTGTGTVSYSVTANTALTARTGSMTIAGTSFAVSQAAAPACTYAFSPTSVSVSAAPITNTVSMIAGTGCAWTATANQPSWLTIQSGGSGTGNGTITYVVSTNSTTGSRVGTITAAGQTLTVTQSGNTPCTYSISPTSAPFVAAGGSSNIVITTLTSCAWTAGSSVSWVTFSTTNGTGSATVSYSVAANTNTVSRSTILTVAGNSFTVTQGAAACSFSITPTSASVAATASSGSVAVTAGTSCAWSAVSNDSWLTITSGTSGSGSGTVAYSIAANPNTAIRAGTLTIAGQTYTVTQAAAACSYTITPTSTHYLEGGGSSTVAVTAGTGCAWTAVSNAGWITVNSGTPGSGNGTVAYTVAANATTSSRTGTITIAGNTFTVTQDGTVPCSYGVTPTTTSFTSAGGTTNITVTANAGCAWSDSSSLSWVALSPTTGTGNATVTLTVAANTSSVARNGTVTIAGTAVSVSQSGAPCNYSITPTTSTYTYVGGSGSVTVTATSGCSWSSSSDSAWLTVTSGASGTGNGTLGYSVASTTSPASRTGRITVAGRVIVVTQTGLPCTPSISPSSASIPAIGSNGIITLTESDPNCSWTATASASWIAASPASGTGSASINYTVLPTNQGTTRTGTITIDGQVFSISQVGDTTVPTITLTSPSNGSTISNTVTLTATASDDISVSRVDFYYDAGILAGTDSTSPYSVPFQTTNVSNAAHTFYARAFDPANNQGFSATNSATVVNSSAVTTNTWVHSYGGTSTDNGLAVTRDAADNIYAVGNFGGTSSFGGSPLTSAGNFDMWLAKFTVGGAAVWSVRFGGVNSEQQIKAIALDGSNNIYVAGYFSSTVNFGGANLVSAGANDIFLAKYSSVGAHVWSERFGGLADDLLYGLAVSSAGDVVICGSFAGSVSFGGATFNSQGGGVDSYFAKYDNTGAHVWSKTFANTSGGVDRATGIGLDSGGNVFVAGFFGPKINLGGGDLFSASSGIDIYLGKFDSSGTYVWGQAGGGVNNQDVTALTVDPSDNVIICGTFQTSTDLGGGTLTGAPSSSPDCYVVKYAGSNGAYQWAKIFGGSLAESVTSVKTDSSGNVIMTGYFNVANMTIGTTTLGNAGSYDIFLAKYSTAGVFSWAKSYGGSGTDTGYGVVADSSGYPIVIGSFNGTANFNGQSITTLGLADAFLMRQSP